MIKYTKPIFIILFVLTYFNRADCKQVEALSCCNRFEVGLEWLYFLPTIDQLYFVGLDEGGAVPGIDGTGKSINQDFHSAYRLDLAYQVYSCDRIILRWTHFHSSDKGFNDQLVSKVPLLAYPSQSALLAENSTATAKNTYQYSYFDLLYELPLFQNCLFLLEFMSGIQISNLKIKQNYQYISPSQNINLFGEYFSNLKGVGPELGLDFSYAIFKNISIKGKALGAFLISQKTTRSDLNSSPLVIANANYNEEKYYISNFITNVRLGLA